MNNTHTRSNISVFDLFTGGPLTNINHSKSADMVIFYNIAVGNMEKMIGHLEDKKYQPIEWKQLSFNEHGYRMLAEYLWKVHTDARNKSDHSLKEDDKAMVNALLGKLNDIRNYHAHIWHDNAALYFPKQLQRFVEDRFDRAVAATFEEDPAAALDFEKKRQKDKKQYALFNRGYITGEGKVFFLSFFLTKGQMSKFLQQRKGSKRTDMPLFKMKHKVYKYYCHRDGASITGFHQEEEQLNAMSGEERADILKARQAYKLISYLYDYPEYYADGDTIPLVLPSKDKGKPLQKVNTIAELLQLIDHNGLFTALKFIPISIPHEDTEQSSKEAFIKSRTVAIQDKEITDHIFHIGFESLYKLVMLSLKYGEEEVLPRLRNAMQVQAAHRNRLYQILNKGLSKLTASDDEYLTDKSHHFLRGYRKLTEKGIVFFERYSKGNKINEKQAEQLEAMLRPLSVPGERSPEPILLYAHDFIEKTEQKFRPVNRFVHFAVHYLIDHQQVKDWYWQVERFDPEKVKQFQQNIDEENGWRLCLDDDHVTVGIAKDENCQEIVLNTAKNDQEQPMYLFRLGPRALRYIMAVLILKEGGHHQGDFSNHDLSVNDFLRAAMKQDMERLSEGSRELKMLEDVYLPSYLKKENDQDIQTQINKLKERFSRMQQEWAIMTSGTKHLRRAEKNRAVMNLYKLFDWSVDDKGVKFLRKDEYNELSICHYSLKDKDKFNHLFYELFKLNHRKPAIPQEIVNILKKSESLGELLERVIEDRTMYIEDQLELLEELPSKLKKKNVLMLSKLLNVPVPSSMLQERSRLALAQKREKTLAVLPFVIHPMMVLKYFGHKSYKENYENKKGISRKDNDLFKALRRKHYTSALHQPHYELDFIDRLITTTEDEAQEKAYNKYKEKWIGRVNTTQTEDAILWQVALKYLSGNVYTQTMAKALEKEGKGLQVGALHKETIDLSLKQGRGTSNEDDTRAQPIWVRLRFHQLDDLMFTVERERLRRAGCHYIMRHKQEADYWSSDTLQTSEKEAREDTNYSYSENSGDRVNPIPYQVLREEMQLVAQHGIYLSGYLLNWERQVLHEHTKALNPEQKQAFLIERTSKKEDQYHYCNFEKVLELSRQLPNETDYNIERYGIDINELKYYRNKAFHNGIPLESSFSFAVRPESALGSFLHVTEPLHQPKDRSKYIVMDGDDK